MKRSHPVERGRDLVPRALRGGRGDLTWPLHAPRHAGRWWLARVGQKTWTSDAARSDWMFAVLRANFDVEHPEER